MAVINKLLFCILVAINALGFSQDISNYNCDSNRFMYGIDEICLRKELAGHSFFVIGETHYFKLNNEIYLELFPYFYKYFNVRIFVLERPYSNGFLLNFYLRTGCPKTLEILAPYDEHERNFIIGLKTIYDLLPPNDKFQIVGISEEENRTTMLKAFSLLMPDSGRPASKIEETVEIMKNFDKYMLSKWSFEEILNEISLFEKEFSAFYGANFQYVHRIIQGYQYAKKLIGLRYGLCYTADLDEIRENMMYSNTKSVLINNPKVSVLLSTGSAHAGLNEKSPIKKFNYVKSLVFRIRNDKAISQRVCTSLVYYGESKGLYKFILSNKNSRKVTNMVDLDRLFFIKMDEGNPIFMQWGKNNFHFLIYKKKKRLSSNEK